MTEKKLSRRDAMKVLGAAVGAAALSTLPSKWNTPELAAGVLPAHARQSGAGLACFPNANTSLANITSSPFKTRVVPAVAGVSVDWSVSKTGTPLTGTVSGTTLSNSFGFAITGVINWSSTGAIGDVLTVTFTSGGSACSSVVLIY